MSAGPNLLASAATLESIRKAACDFYCGTPVDLIPAAEHEWKISTAHNGKILEGVRVIKKRNRFRFEMVTP